MCSIVGLIRGICLSMLMLWWRLSSTSSNKPRFILCSSRSLRQAPPKGTMLGGIWHCKSFLPNVYRHLCGEANLRFWKGPRLPALARCCRSSRRPHLRERGRNPEDGRRPRQKAGAERMPRCAVREQWVQRGACPPLRQCAR